jgi:hypothetical protein
MTAIMAGIIKAHSTPQIAVLSMTDAQSRPIAVADGEHGAGHLCDASRRVAAVAHPEHHRHRHVEDQHESASTSKSTASPLAEIGEIDRARALCEKLLSHASPLLLYAEEIDPHSGRHLGNFPRHSHTMRPPAR